MASKRRSNVVAAVSWDSAAAALPLPAALLRSRSAVSPLVSPSRRAPIVLVRLIAMERVRVPSHALHAVHLLTLTALSRLQPWGLQLRLAAAS